jgi:hypothetical protein
MERLHIEEARKYVPYCRTPLAPPPKYFAFIQDKDGWEQVDYFTGRLRQSVEGGKGDQYVYVLANSSFPEMLKIGYTKNDPEERALQLSKSTGVPLPFDVVYSYSCFNGERIEKEVHKQLKEKRVRGEREFFYVSLDEAKQVIRKVGEQFD